MWLFVEKLKLERVQVQGSLSGEILENSPYAYFVLHHATFVTKSTGTLNTVRVLVQLCLARNPHQKCTSTSTAACRLLYKGYCTL
jgi:hypothetical protein